jgi:hypothetical protein
MSENLKKLSQIGQKLPRMHVGGGAPVGERKKKSGEGAQAGGEGGEL